MNTEQLKEVPVDQNTQFFTSSYVTEAKNTEVWNSFWSKDHDDDEEYSHDSEGCYILKIVYEVDGCYTFESNSGTGY